MIKKWRFVQPRLYDCEAALQYVIKLTFSIFAHFLFNLFAMNTLKLTKLRL